MTLQDSLKMRRMKKSTTFVLSAIVAGFILSQFDHRPVDDCNHQGGIYINGTCQEKEVAQ